MSEVRPIDANELKDSIVENIRQLGDQCSPVMLTMFSLFSDIIENAPTVEISQEQAIDKLNETGWLIKHDKEMTERPQGKWVENLMHNTICSNCHGIRRDNRVDYIAFCNKCGAKMKGGAE